MPGFLKYVRTLLLQLLGLNKILIKVQSENFKMMLDLLSFKRYHDFVTKSCITGDHDRIIRISWSKRSLRRPDTVGKNL